MKQDDKLTNLLNQVKELIPEQNWHTNEKIISTIKSLQRAKIHKDKTTNTVYADLSIGNIAFKLILEDDKTVADAMDTAAHTLGREEDYVQQVKNKSYLHTKDIVNKFSKHPRYVHIKKNSALGDALLKKQSTLYQLLNTLRLHKNDSDRIDRLEDEVVQLKSRVDTLEIDMEIIKDSSELDMDDKKKKVCVMKAKGFKIKDLAKHFNVSESTIKRWTKENNNEYNT